MTNRDGYAGEPDIVKVVRCCKCEHFQPTMNYSLGKYAISLRDYCEVWDKTTRADGYCHKGERNDE